MTKYLLLFFLFIQNCFAYDLNSVCEVTSSEIPENKEDWSADLGTGLVVQKSEKYLYIIISDYLVNKVVKFSWTSETQPFYTEKINPEFVYSAFGELVNKSQEHELALYRIPIIPYAKINLPKFAETKAFEKIVLISKDYNKENYTCKYKFTYGNELFKINYKNNDRKNKNIEIECKWMGDPPMGGGIVINDKEEIVCFINYLNLKEKDKKIITGPSGNTIKEYLKFCLKKDEVPEAPETE